MPILVLPVQEAIVCGVTAAAAPGPRHGRSGPSSSDATPAEVRAALIPEEAAEFDQQWRNVMARATEALDLPEVLATLESWRRVARLTTVTGPEAHRAMYRRAAARLAGDDIPADEPLLPTKARSRRFRPVRWHHSPRPARCWKSRPGMARHTPSLSRTVPCEPWSRPDASK